MPVALPSTVRSSFSISRNTETGRVLFPRYEAQADEHSRFSTFLKEELGRLYALLREGQAELAAKIPADTVVYLASRFGEDFQDADGSAYFALADYLERRAAHLDEPEASRLRGIAGQVYELSPLAVFALADLMGRLHKVAVPEQLFELAPAYRSRARQGAGVTGT